MGQDRLPGLAVAAAADDRHGAEAEAEAAETATAMPRMSAPVVGSDVDPGSDVVVTPVPVGDVPVGIVASATPAEYKESP